MRYIDVEPLEEKLKEHIKKTESELMLGALSTFLRVLDITPTADVAPVRHERWVTTDENIGGHCSNCGMECSSVEWGDDYLMKPTWNYCPNCGAKMDEGDEDEID